MDVAQIGDGITFHLGAFRDFVVRPISRVPIKFGLIAHRSELGFFTLSALRGERDGVRWVVGFAIGRRPERS